MRETVVWILAPPLIGWVTLGELSDLSEPNYLIYKVEKEVTSARQIAGKTYNVKRAYRDIRHNHIFYYCCRCHYVQLAFLALSSKKP